MTRTVLNPELFLFFSIINGTWTCPMNPHDTAHVIQYSKEPIRVATHGALNTGLYVDINLQPCHLEQFYVRIKYTHLKPMSRVTSCPAGSRISSKSQPSALPSSWLELLEYSVSLMFSLPVSEPLTGVVSPFVFSSCAGTHSNACNLGELLGLEEAIAKKIQKLIQGHW